jgi:hypothetical protein
VLVHLEHGHLLRAEDRLELLVGQDLAAVLRVLQVVLLMYAQTLLTTSPRGRGSGPTTAASSAEGRSGCCSAFGFLPPVSSFAAAALPRSAPSVPWPWSASSSSGLLGSGLVRRPT